MLTEPFLAASMLAGSGAALAAGPDGHRVAWLTALAWGAAEMALRLRLMLRPGLRERLRGWPALAAGRLREWTFFVVVTAIAIAVIAAMWLVRFRWAATGGGWLIIGAGELAAAAGIALRFWAIATLDRFFTFIVGIAGDHQVVQRGPYRVLRHPGYAGALLTLLGIGITLGNWLSLLLIVAAPALALGLRIQVEERILVGALGAQYRGYADRTARLIPGLW